MGRPKTNDLQKHTLNLRAGDMKRLGELFPNRSPSVMIRRLVSTFIDRIDAPEETPASIDTTSINLPIE